MCLEENFKFYVEKVKQLKNGPTNEEKLNLYGLYKQAIIGDINISQPWAVQLEANAKWTAWNKNQGMNSNSAKEKYIDFVKILVNKYN